MPSGIAFLISNIYGRPSSPFAREGSPIASSLRLLACGTIVAGALLAGCGGGVGGIGPSPVTTLTPSAASPVTASPSTASPVTAAPVTPTPASSASAGSTSTPAPIASGTAAASPTATPVAGATTPPASATATPVAATPTPVAVATATAPPGVANDHPSDSGNTFSYAGSNVTTITRPNQYPSPEPTQTTAVSFTQNVTITNPATFAGNSSAIDYETLETDTQTAPVSQTSHETIDSYYAYTGTPYVGNFQYLGYTSVDDADDTVQTTYQSGGDIADELPEASGARWTNPPTSTIVLAVPSQENSTQTYAADGSYVTNITYPQDSSSFQNTAMVQSNIDGSGTLMTPYIGNVLMGESSFSVSAPSAAGTSGTITVTEDIAPAAGSTSTPSPTTTSIPNWIPTGFVGTALITESDQDMGSMPLPATCTVPASLGTSGNVILQTISRVDPMLGQTEVTKTTNYVIPNVGTACVAIDDLLTYYYDFSGQDTTQYDFGSVPQQISELQQTLSLSAQQLQSAARSGGRRFALSREVHPHVQIALAHIAAARNIERARFLRSAATHRRFIATSHRIEGIL